MELVAGRTVQPRCGLAAPRRSMAAVLGLLACGTLAEELAAAPGDMLAAGGPRERTQLELTSRSLPLFEPADGATRASRLDMIWLPPRRPNLGLVFGLSSMDGPGLRPSGAGAQSIDLGFHWRYTLDSQYRIDVTAWRRVGPTDAAALAQNRHPGYSARVEMQIKSMPSSGFVADRGFLGLQLDGGARITVRRKHGRPMFYYRTRF